MKILRKYSSFNLWANEILFSLIENELNDEKLNKEIVSSFPSLRKTVYHIWDAEFIWLKRLNGESLSSGPGKLFKGSFSDAGKEIISIDHAFIEFVKNSDEKKLSDDCTYKNIEGKYFTNPVWESVLHCVNHSTYHRGQIVTMIRQLGFTNIPSTDFISYCRI